MAKNDDLDFDDLLFDHDDKTDDVQTEEKVDFNLFQGAEAGKPASKETDYPIAGVGLYSFTYKMLSFLAVILAGAALGGISVAVCYFMDLYYFYVLKYIPVMNLGALILFYIFFPVHGYNYKKSGETDRPEKGSPLYKKMNSMYYTNCRAIIMLVLILLFDVSIIVFSNFVY